MQEPLWQLPAARRQKRCWTGLSGAAGTTPLSTFCQQSRLRKPRRAFALSLMQSIYQSQRMVSLSPGSARQQLPLAAYQGLVAALPGASKRAEAGGVCGAPAKTDRDETGGAAEDADHDALLPDDPGGWEVGALPPCLPRAILHHAHWKLTTLALQLG